MNLQTKQIPFDIDLSKLVSYLTFDGHLAKDLSCFYLSSKHKEVLSVFEDIVFRKFNIKGRLEENDGYNKTHKYRVFNAQVCRFFEQIGVPKGSKVTKSFLIPDWIKKDKELSMYYLQVAFDCEGSIWFEKQPKIRFGIFKIEELMENNFAFINEMKELLLGFDIETTNSWLMKGNLRKDGMKTNGVYFKIKQSSIQQFAKEVGFNDRFKKLRLSSVSSGTLRVGLHNDKLCDTKL
jgi:hypothetical protein